MRLDALGVGEGRPVAGRLLVRPYPSAPTSPSDRNGGIREQGGTCPREERAVEVARAVVDRDAEFRLRLAAGDDGALAEVYDLFAGYVHHLALRVTADPEAARDVVQEVFTELWCHPLAFDPGRGALRTWLATLAHRRAVDWVRKEVSRRRVAESYAAHHRLQSAGARTVEDEVLAGESVLLVRHLVDLLPQPLQEAIDLTYYRGHTCRAAAVELGIPEGTFKSRLRRAMTRLGAELGEVG